MEKDIWLMRTYAGHSSAKETNALYKNNLLKGQTGLSVAFDLPTQTGYDCDHPLAKGEVGKVGVPVSDLHDMRVLFNGLPLDKMNTSMTINATAPWLLALYIALAEETGADVKALKGTTQNDIIKEYLSRGTYIFPPEPSVRLTADMIAYTYKRLPKWNPTNICSYHLQEAGADSVQEVAFALADAIEILDRVRGRSEIPAEDMPKIVGRISFFVNSGVKFIKEICKLRAFAILWDEIALNRYGVTEPDLRRFRYGVQVNSLGLTEQQPENNVYRILLSSLGVTLAADTRARALQLPAWNEALGLPRMWDQQWSLRMQQILAYETDILDYPDIFKGSEVIEKETGLIIAEVKKKLQMIEERGGAAAAIESGYMKSELVNANATRMAEIEKGERVSVGVNRFHETETPPAGLSGENFQKPFEHAEREQISALQSRRAARDGRKAQEAIKSLQNALKNGENVMPVSIECAKAGVTTGEWANALREIFGEYRPPTGVTIGASGSVASLAEVREKVNQLAVRLGRRPKILIGKPGLDGHSNGAEQIAVRAGECGFDVVYEGIRSVASDLVKAAIEESVHLIGISCLAGGHAEQTAEILLHLNKEGAGDIPLIVGGIIPASDAQKLIELGVTRIYTPKNFDLTAIMADFCEIIAQNLQKKNAA